MTLSGHRYGPYDDFTKAWKEATSAGFSIASRNKVLVVSAVVEDPVEDDATAWVGVDHLGRSMLVIELPAENRRDFPGNLDWTEVRKFERQWSWPIWAERSSITVPILGPTNRSIDRREAEALLQAPSDGFELMLRIEMLGIGRTGKSEIVVHQPIRLHTLRAARETLVNGIPLQDQGT